LSIVSQARASYSVEDQRLSAACTYVSSYTGQTIILPPELDGLVSFHLVDTDDLLPAFELYLDSIGYTLAPVAESVHVIIPRHDYITPEQRRIIGDWQHTIYTPSRLPGRLLYNRLPPQVQASCSLLPSGALLIYGTRADYHRSHDLIIASDIAVPPRIHIEAIVYERTKTDTYERGLSFLLSKSDLIVSGSYPHTTIADLIARSVSSVGLWLGDFSALVSLMDTADDINVLSAPRIMVNSGEQGVISVGRDVPIITGTSTSNGVVTQTIQRQDVGVKLVVVPEYITDGLVRVQVVQTSSSIATDIQASDITTNKREIQTVVDVVPGETFSLGGLRSSDRVSNRIGVPGLKKVPFIRRLVSYEKDQITEKDLSIILRVTMI
jgi:type II secretory pathway component GspD/PulD (secretin)